MAIDLLAELTSAATSTYPTVVGFDMSLVTSWWVDVFQTTFGGILLFLYSMRWWLIVAFVFYAMFQPVIGAFSFFSMGAQRYKDH